MTASKPTRNFHVATNDANESVCEVKWLDVYAKALVKSAHCYSVLLDPEMKILYHSDSLPDLAGIGEGETLLGRSAQEVYGLIYDENLYPGAIRRLERVLSGETYFFENDTIVLPDGEKRLYQINYKKITGETDHFEGVLVYAQDVTDLRLEEAQQRVNTLLHASILPCCVWDENGDVIAYNRAAAKTFGVLPDMPAHDFGALMVSALQPKHQPCGRESEVVRRELVNEALQNGFAEIEGFLQKNDGSPLFVRVTILRALWPSGFRLIVYIQDRTENYLREKEVERIREQNELQLAKLNLVVQASGAGLWEMAVAGDDPVNPANIFMWSDEFRHMLGFTDESDFPNVLGSWTDRLHPDDKEKTLEHIVRHLSDTSGLTPYDVEYQLLKKDGQYGYFHTTGSTFRDADGSPLRIVGTLMDITEAKNILIDTEMQRTAAEASEERVRIMLDRTPMMCVLLDVQGNIVDCNEEAVKILEASSKTEFMRDFFSFYPEYQADGSRTADKIREILQFLDTAEEPSYHLERTFQTASGEIVPVESTIVRIPRQQGNYYLSFSRDLREEKAQEKELEEIRAEKTRAEIQREAALAAAEAKSVFLATMSHEIRTPMNAVLGMVELLLAENLNERQLQYVKDVRMSAMALLDIVNDILDLSKIQVGKLRTQSRHYDFSMLIDNLGAMACFLVSRKSIAFNLTMPEGPPVYLYGDEVRLRQAILNLLSNAIKFTDEGAVDLIVSFTESTVKITVSDTGIGILPEEIPRLFEPFEQFDTSKVQRDEGTGLGLPITKAIVELMEGQLTVESVYGQGSSFHMEIPMVPGDEAQVLRENDNSGMFYAPQAKLLVVDDNQANLKVAGGLLQLFRISSETVSSGRDAIRMVQDNDYDLVLMDYRMPEMDGDETTREIRNLGLTVPIIACTASVIAEVKVKMMEAGMNDFLAKPITKADLKNILKKWIPAGKMIEATEDGAVFDDMEDDRYRKFWGAVENIQGLSVPLGLSRVGGQRDVYEDTLKLIMKEIEKSRRNLDEFLNAGNLKSFAIEVHSMLGLLANVGAMELSEKARELELASDRRDIDFCIANLPHLTEGLTDMRHQLQSAFSWISHDDDLIIIPEELPPVFEEILKALDDVDLMRIKREMNTIDAMNLQGALKEKTEDIKDAVMMMDYATTAELIQKLLEKE